MTINRDDQPIPVPNKLLFRVGETCQILGIGRSSFYEETKAGRLMVTRAAGRTLVHRQDLHEYADARRAESVTLH